MSNNIGNSMSYLGGSNSAAASGLRGSALNGRMSGLSGGVWRGNGYGSSFLQLSQRTQLAGLYQAMTSMMQMFMQLIQRFVGADALGGAVPGADSKLGSSPGGSADSGTASSTGNASGTNGTGGSTSADGAASAAGTGNIKEDGKKDQVKNLSTSTDANGNIQVKTEDGWVVSCQGKQQDWTITGPDGKVTRVWGDPHVVESDGDTFDFTKQSSFRFGRNKVTVEVAPYGDTGQTLTKTITVYHGRERVTITGIDENKPRIVAAADDAWAHDRGLADGDVYSLGKEMNGDDQWNKRIEKPEAGSNVSE